MDPLRELLAIDHRQALEFFVLRLQDVSEPTVDRQELLYNASLLAHYARYPHNPTSICRLPRISARVMSQNTAERSERPDARGHASR